MIDYRKIIFKRYYLQYFNSKPIPVIRNATGKGIQVKRTNRKRKWLEKHGSI